MHCPKYTKNKNYSAIFETYMGRNSMVVLIHPSDNVWKSNCKVLYAQQPVAITEDRQHMKFSGSSSWCWKGSIATAIGFKNWNRAKHQCRELWVLPAPMVVNSSLCCDLGVLPLAAKIRTRNMFALLCLTKSIQTLWIFLVSQNLECVFKETPCFSALPCWHFWISLSKADSYTQVR